MLFNSWQFFLFFPIVTLLYFLIPHRWRWGLLLLALFLRKDSGKLGIVMGIQVFFNGVKDKKIILNSRTGKVKGMNRAGSARS